MLKLVYTSLVFMAISLITSCNTGDGNSTNEQVINSAPTDETAEKPVLAADTAVIPEIKEDPAVAAEKAVKPVEVPEKAEVRPPKKASISFAEPIHDFGRVIEGAFVFHTFEFTNTGKADLVIEKAITTCGCTSPEFSKEPIPPGESGIVKVVFDSKGRLGNQDKFITLVTNGDPPSQIIRMQGIVATE